LNTTGKKFGGRQKGTTNVVTKELRERFKDFADDNFPKVQKWLDRCAETDPDKALTIYLQLTERVIGKAPTQIDVTSGGRPIQAPIINVYGEPPAD